jgi:cytochrome c oxidase assembly factor CtaG
MRARELDNRRLRTVAGIAGLLALLAAAGPFEHLGASSLTAHMVQHLLLFAVAPPLLVLALPLPARFRLRRDGAWRWIMAAAVVTQSTVMVFWHLPGPFGAALTHAPVHALEHASLLAAGLLFWWAVIDAGRHWHYGAAVIAVFIGCLPAIGVGAAMTLAPHPWWTGFTLADQQMAGVLMWSVGGLIDLVAAVALFRSWMVAMEPAG